MAEVVGLVASGASIGALAAQIATTIVRLRHYWNEIRDAPEEISYLINEVEIVIAFLVEDEEDQHRFRLPDIVANNALAQQSLKFCLEGAKALQSLVEDLRSQLDTLSSFRRRAIAVKVVFKKDQIRRYKSRLESAIRFLMMSERYYTRALMRLQPEIIVSRISQIVMSSETSNESPSSHLLTERCRWGLQRTISTSFVNSDTENTEHPDDLAMRSLNATSNSPSVWLLKKSYKPHNRGKSRQRRYLIARFSAPSWIISKVLEVCGLKLSTGWQISFQTYHILPRNARFFEYARAGDVNGLRQMLKAREATPFDRAEDYGETALHFAIFYGQLEVCQALIEEGADVTATLFFSERTPLHEVSSCGGRLTFKEQAPVLDIIRSLLDSGAEDLLIGDRSVLSEFRGPKEAFKILQDHSYPPYYADNPREKPYKQIKAQNSPIVVPGSWKHQSGNPRTIRLVLGRGVLEADVVGYDEVSKRTLFHYIAKTFAYRILDDVLFAKTSAKLFLANSSKCSSIYDDGFNCESVLRKLDWRKAEYIWQVLFQDALLIDTELDDSNKVERQTSVVSEMKELAYRRWREPSLPQDLQAVVKNWLADLRKSDMSLHYEVVESSKQLSGDEVEKNSYCWHSTERKSISIYLINFNFSGSPKEWKFRWSQTTDMFAGEFWFMTENPQPEMPGSWLEEWD